MSEQINKVLYNCDQTSDTTAAQKAQARANIGAQAQLTAGANVTIDANNVISAAGFSGVSAVGPIYGDGTSGDPLVLRTSHGLSLVQSSEDNITRLQVTHPVPAPGATSTNKVLTCTDALENLAWRDVPTGPSIQKQNYGDTDPSAVSTLLIDSDDPENYTLLKADNVTKGFLVQGPYKTLLDSGVNGVGDTTTPIYIDTDGTFKALSSTPAGIFMAYYSGYSTGHDNTSYDDIKAASDAGKAVFAYTNVGGGVLFYTLDNIDSTHAMFRRTLNKMSSILTVQESDDSYSLTNVSLQGELTAGTGISISNDTVSWEYTVGRNLHINQNNAIQTDFGGGKLAPTSTNWEDVGNFSTSFRLVARANTNGTYDIGLRYYAGGLTTHFTFIGTQTVATAGSTAVTVTKCNYVHTQTEYSYCTQIGDHFNPASMQSMMIEGTMFAGTQHDFRAVIWVDENSTVQVAFTAIEVGRVGSTV